MSPAGKIKTASAGYKTESDNAPAPAVAECPEGNELDEGVFISGVTLASRAEGRRRSKRCLVPSAKIQDKAIAPHGTIRLAKWKPVTRKAPAAINPHSAPAVPATVNHRIIAVSGTRFNRKMARNKARSRSLTVRINSFNLFR